MSDQKGKIFRIRLAGITVEIRSQYPDVMKMCRDYLCESEPDLVLFMTREDIEQERKRYPDGRKRTPGFIESLAVYRKLAQEVLEYETLLIHGSAVAVDGEGYLFLASSGTGKSTHTKLWRQCFGDRAEMINDDKPFLRLRDQQIWVCGTPWNGKHRLDTNKNVPLKGICILKRGKKNSIRRALPMEVYPDILRQVYRPLTDEKKMKKTLEIVDEILKIPLFDMECTVSKEAAQMAYEEMKKETI